MIMKIVTWFSLLSAVTLVVSLTVLASPTTREYAFEFFSGHSTPLGVGDEIPADGGLLGDKAYTVLILARSSCPACQRSKPFFRELLSVLSEEPQVAAILASTERLSPAEVALGSEMGVTEAHVVQAPREVTRRIPSVPTVMLLDRSGKVRMIKTAGLTSVGQALTLAGKIRREVASLQIQ
jgi:hypothetical protein